MQDKLRCNPKRPFRQDKFWGNWQHEYLEIFFFFKFYNWCGRQMLMKEVRRERKIEYSFLIHTFRNSRRSLKSYIHFLRLKILFLGVKRVYFGWLWKKCIFFQSIYDGLKLDTIWGRKYKSFRNVNIVRVTRLLRMRWTLHVICMPIKWCDQKKTFSVKLMEKTP